MGNDCEELTREEIGSLDSAKHKLLKSKARGSNGSKSCYASGKQQGWKRVKFETDCKQVIDGINREDDDVVISTVASDIKKLKLNFDECCFSFTRTINNSVSHIIANFAINLK